VYLSCIRVSSSTDSYDAIDSCRQHKHIRPHKHIRSHKPRNSYPRMASRKFMSFCLRVLICCSLAVEDEAAPSRASDSGRDDFWSPIMAQVRSCTARLSVLSGQPLSSRWKWRQKPKRLHARSGRRRMRCELFSSIDIQRYMHAMDAAKH
jgi:hypothetical protein